VADLDERISCLEGVVDQLQAQQVTDVKAEGLTALGLACDAAGRHMEALDWYRVAANAYRDLGDLEGEARAWQYAGMMLKSLDRFEEAIGCLRTASVLYADVRNRTQMVEYEAWALMDLADCHLATGDSAEALFTYETALAVGQLGDGTINVTTRPLWGMGRCYWTMDDLVQARRSYAAAIDDAERYVATYDEEARRQWLYESVRKLYEEYIRLLSEVDDWVQDMFPVSERCRARTFIDLLVGGPIGPLEAITEAGIESRSINSEVLLRDMEKVISELSPRAAVVSYFVAESAVFVWTITRGHVSDPIRIEIPRAQLLDLVLDFRQTIETQPPQGQEPTALLEILSQARDLHDLLLSPVAEGIAGYAHLVIVPSGPLHYLPFAALYDCPGCEEGALWGGQYLIERSTLSYLPSLTTLKYAQEKGRHAEAEPTIFALGDPDSGNPDYRRLPGAQAEVQAIARLFPGPPEPVVVVDIEATKTALREHSAGVRHVLLSTHGFFNPENPMASYLLMAPTEQDDEKLYTHEVFGLGLRADLVTLSACETLLPSLRDAERQERAVRGAEADDKAPLPPELLERITAGDELVGLTRAFIYAGTPTVLSTLWSVYDESTKHLMVAFYRKLLDGQTDKAEALRQAQLLLLRDPIYRHPVHWAAFTLYGDWRSASGAP